MTTDPLTTEQIRNLVAWNPVTGEYDADRYAAFDEWQRAAMSDAWDGGFIAGLCFDPGKTNNEGNPYSQGVDA